MSTINVTLPHLLRTRQAGGGQVSPDGPGGWQLAIPGGPGGQYRWAQLDDYTELPRREFHWNPPAILTVRARVSGPELHGTWGFGFWNDPFSAGFGLGGMARRFPALPNTAWFFYASQPNYLSFRDDLPASGMLAATFRSPRLPAPLLALGMPAAPFLLLPPAARLARRFLRKLVKQSAVRLSIDVTAWHTYRLIWDARRVTFMVDGEEELRTRVSPGGPLGLVLWIDNQFAAFSPDGRLRTGALSTDTEQRLSLADFHVE